MRLKFQRPTRRSSGFTLIELLVVISIIALLISILLPALSSAREQASRISCASSARQVTLAMLTYADANADFLPVARWNYPNYVGHGARELYRNYGVRENLVKCPSSDAFLPSTAKWSSLATTSSEGAVAWTSYFYVAGAGTRNDANGPDGWRRKGSGWLTTSFPQAKPHGFVPAVKASNPVMFAAGVPDSGTDYQVPAQPSLLPVFIELNFVTVNGSNWSASASYYPPRPNHVNRDGNAVGGNNAWLDGHVTWSRMQAGVSWRIFAGVGNGGFVTTPQGAPSGATLWNP